MKKIAFYLPQYHSIPENDAWWGKGFTEWTNVKKAKPSFKGHLQPEVPLNHNYYSLLDSKTQVWQSETALKYGIDGFCYYHYWFEGKLLLEKPMEAILKNPDVKMPFCICWANESWARTWDGDEVNFLIKQNYHEGKAMWKKHFDYLLQFFLDPRYILDNGRPMLIIYKPYLIENCEEMIKYWRFLAKKAGFKDLYVGYQYPKCFDYDMTALGFDFGIEFEPVYTSDKKTTFQKIVYYSTHPKLALARIKYKVADYPSVLSYDDTWRSILKRKRNKTNIYPGAFTSWDNTPRRGKKATVYVGSSPDKFAKYVRQLAQTMKENGGGL